MDADRFDALTRSLSAGLTRRGVTRLLGGLALSGFLPSLASAAKTGGHGKDGGHGKKGGKGKDKDKKGKQGNDGKKSKQDPSDEPTRDLPNEAAAPANGEAGGDEVTAARDSFGEPTGSSPKINPPEQSYLALGDSLAFGFQFDIFNQHFPDVPPTLFEHGYVDDLSQMLHPIRPDMETINYGCPGETTDSFIRGGCLYTARGFVLHDSYSGSQLDAALTFLRAHQDQVSPITFNLGTNDLNTLSDLCGDDVSCYKRQAPIVLDQIAENLDAILSALRAAAPNSEILTFTTYNVDPNFTKLIDAFNAVVVKTAAAHGVRVADVFEAFEHETICDLTLVCTPLMDSHPSDAGYQVIAEQLWRASPYKKLEH